MLVAKCDIRLLRCDADPFTGTYAAFQDVGGKGRTVRSEYVAPEIEELGTVAELTLGEAEGSKLDADFAAGTLFGDITFS